MVAWLVTLYWGLCHFTLVGPVCTVFSPKMIFDKKNSAGEKQEQVKLGEYVKNVNITIMEQLFKSLDRDHPRHGQCNRHVTNIIVMAFFFVLRPVEYLKPRGDKKRSTPFHLCDVHFAVNGRQYVAMDTWTSQTWLMSLWHSPTKRMLSGCGERIGHAASGDPRLCPVVTAFHINTTVRLGCNNSTWLDWVTLFTADLIPMWLEGGTNCYPKAFFHIRFLSDQNIIDGLLTILLSCIFFKKIAKSIDKYGHIQQTS